MYLIYLWLLAGFLVFQEVPRATSSVETFVNPIAEGADPWVVRNPLAETATTDQPPHFAASYYWCLSDANRRIAIYTADRLTGLGQKHIVWRAPRTGPYSRQLWAPELHFLDGRWYIYVAASDGDNANHLAYVLESESEDVMGPYQVRGPLATGEGDNGRSPNIWAIDMTVMEHQGKRYALWSGWDAPGTDRQYLYIAPMETPTRLSGKRVRLCANDDYLWERLEPGPEHRGLNEGPEVFQSAGKTFVYYSCGASWLPTYKLGRLELVGDDPLDPEAWKKSPEPVFQATDTVYGVGHSCFVPSPDGQQWWHVFHAKRDRDPGWRRAIHVQPMTIQPDGTPDLGTPADPSMPQQWPREKPVPATGDIPPLAGAWEPLEDGSPFDYFGHHQLLDGPRAQGTRSVLRLGELPPEPVNLYRSGEKVVFHRFLPDRFSAAVKIDFKDGQQSRDAGFVLGCRQPAVGYDAQQSLFVGLIPRDHRVILGRTDGANWHELARAATTVEVGKPQHLEVVCRDAGLEVFHNQQSVLKFATPVPVGRLGVRVVDSDVLFHELVVRPQ